MHGGIRGTPQLPARRAEASTNPGLQLVRAPSLHPNTTALAVAVTSSSTVFRSLRHDLLTSDWIASRQNGETVVLVGIRTSHSAASPWSQAERQDCLALISPPCARTDTRGVPGTEGEGGREANELPHGMEPVIQAQSPSPMGTHGHTLAGIWLGRLALLNSTELRGKTLPARPPCHGLPLMPRGSSGGR